MENAMAGLSVGGSESYDDTSTPPGGKRGRAPTRGMLERQDSYDVTPTMTFKADDDLQIKPEGMLTSSPTGRQLKTNLLYTDLENVKILGRGATSKVFLSKHKPSGAMYAVKELNAMADDDTRRMACNELRIAHKHASHAEHLVHFIDAFFANDKICIAMEFCDAGSYEDVIKRTSGEGVPSDALGAITYQLVQGLQYLHREVKQVHRDLKPANVMLTRQGVAKLSDFGISKQLASTAAVAMTQVGTTMYMAPERLTGDRYGWTSDVWSVGIITLEALTAVHPFDEAGKTYFGLHDAILKQPSPTPPDGTPAEICEFIALCLLKDAGTNTFAPPTDAAAGVRALPAGLIVLPWMRQCGSSNPKQVLAQHLQETCS